MGLYYLSEIIEALEHEYNNNPFELLLIYDDLWGQTGDQRFKDIIDNICLDNNICPVCFTRLYVITKRENRGECRGTPSYEEIHLKHCLNCGWEDS